MASLKSISLAHGTIPTQMFGNVNLQNAVMYINENFTNVRDGVNEAIAATEEMLGEKADADHNHDDAYSALEHTHGMNAVVGLSAALDGKADLNHEHSQYLSELPAHYHNVQGIQGLQDALDKRAEKVHTHEMSQVGGLASELGAKASTAYVDQQVKNLTETLGKAPDIGSDQTALGHFPDNLDYPGGDVLWQAGRGVGAKVVLLFVGEENSVGTCDLKTCKLVISTTGTIARIESVANGGINIDAGVM